MKILDKACIFFLFIILGCGNSHKAVTNCISQLEYTSTTKYEFIAYQLVDKSTWRSFDELRLARKNGYYLQIIRKDSQNIKDIAGDAVTITRFPIGTKLVLTGNAIEVKPWGMQKTFSYNITYLEGKVEGLTVWIASFRLKDLSKSTNKQNRINNDLIRLNEIEWNCPDSVH